MDVGIPESTAIGLLLVVLAIPVALFIGAFLIGSIPFGYLVSRLCPHTDRKQGSGNVETTNPPQLFAQVGAATVLLLDALKGFVPTLFVVLVFRGFLDSPDLPPTSQIFGAVVAAGVLLGHTFSPWLRWRGDKSVATSFGAIFGLCWPAGLVVLAASIIGVIASRYSSLGAILGSILAPFAIWFFTGSIPETLFGAFSAVLVVITRRESISRLRNGA
jgi:glycerol-3-phosphate acyltransferase PlsY